VVGEGMLPSNLKEGILEEHLQEVGANQEDSRLRKDLLPGVIKIKVMKGTSEGRNLDRINTVNPKEDMRIDQDPNIQKEIGNMGEGNLKEGNIKSAKIEKEDIHHNKEGNIKRDMIEGDIHRNKEGNVKSAKIEERDIHRNKEETLKLNIDGIHKVSTMKKEWHKRFHRGNMQNPGKGDLLQDLEKVVEEIIVQIAEGKFTVIQTAAFYVDGAMKQRIEELHLTSPEEMMTSRGKEIKVNHKEEVPQRDGKDR
jgi:hypothetical protein